MLPQLLGQPFNRRMERQCIGEQLLQGPVADLGLCKRDRLIKGRHFGKSDYGRIRWAFLLHDGYRHGDLLLTRLALARPKEISAPPSEP